MAKQKARSKLPAAKAGGRRPGGGPASGAAASKKPNPFELQRSRTKFSIVGRKIKGSVKNVVQARQDAHNKRKSTLLVEYKSLRKANTFKDKRLGEAGGLSQDDKALERLRALRMKQAARHKKGSKFALSDADAGGEGLTHMGRSLSEMDDFEEAPPSLEELDEDMVADLVATYNFGGGGGQGEGGGEGAQRKTHKQVMEEIIAKSKAYKALKAKQREEDEQELDKLNAEFRELVSQHSLRALMKPAGYMKGVKLPAESEVDTAYDATARSLADEARGAAGDRVPTVEELEERERLRLEALERERVRRMRGDEGEGLEPRGFGSADAAGGGGAAGGYAARRKRLRRLEERHGRGDGDSEDDDGDGSEEEDEGEDGQGSDDEEGGGGSDDDEGEEEEDGIPAAKSQLEARRRHQAAGDHPLQDRFRAKAAQLLAKYGVDASNPLVTHAPRGSDDDDSEGDEDDEGDEGDEGEDEEDSSSDEEGEQGDEEVGATASGEEEEEEEGGDGARLGSEDGASGSDEGEGASSDEGEEEEGGSGDDVGEGESGSGEGEEEEEGRSDEEEGDGLAAMQRRLQQRQQAAGVGAEVARPSPYVLRLPPLEPKKPSAASANGAAATAAQQQQQQQEGEGGELQDDGDDAPLDLPYTIRMPETYQGFAELVRGRPARHLLLAIERIRAFNAAALAADAKRQLQVFFGMLVQHFAMLAGGEGFGGRLPMQHLDALTAVLLHMIQEVPFYGATVARARLQKMHERLNAALSGAAAPPQQPPPPPQPAAAANGKRPKAPPPVTQAESAWPGPRQLLQLQLFATLFPLSDKRHPVVTPLTLLVAKFLSQCTATSLPELGAGLALCSLAQRAADEGQRYAPEVLNFLTDAILSAAAPTPGAGKGEEGLVGTGGGAPRVAPGLLAGARAAAGGEVRAPGLVAVLEMSLEGAQRRGAGGEEAAALAAGLLGVALAAAGRAARGVLAVCGPAAPQALQPLLRALRALGGGAQRAAGGRKAAAAAAGGPALLPAALEAQRAALVSELEAEVRKVVASRTPMVQASRARVPVAKEYNPRFEEEGFMLGRDYDPDRVRAEQRKLRRQLQKEKRGAIRELRRDAVFLASERDREKAQVDAERLDNQKRFYSELQMQEADMRSGGQKGLNPHLKKKRKK